MPVRYIKTESLNPLQKEYRSILFSAADRLKYQESTTEIMETINVLLGDLNSVLKKFYN